MGEYRFATTEEIRAYASTDPYLRGNPSWPIRYSRASRSADMAFFAELKRLEDNDYGLGTDMLLGLASTNFWTEVDNHGNLVLALQMDQNADDDGSAAELMRIPPSKLNWAGLAAREMARGIAFRLWLAVMELPHVSMPINE